MLFRSGSGAVITVYKNGVQFKQATIAPAIGTREGKVQVGGPKPADRYFIDGVQVYYYAWYIQTARIMDFEVTGAATYTITFSSWSGTLRVGTTKRGYNVNGETRLTFQGQVTVGFRKR